MAMVIDSTRDDFSRAMAKRSRSVFRWGIFYGGRREHLRGLTGAVEVVWWR